MQTRDVLPLCAPGVAEKCFDVKTDQVVQPVKMAEGGDPNMLVAAVGWPQVLKQYTKIQHMETPRRKE
jgi:hypothetical protein